MLPTRCCPAHPSAAGTRHLWHRALPQPVPNPLECTAEVVWAAIRALRPLLRRYGECETLMTDTVAGGVDWTLGRLRPPRSRHAGGVCCCCCRCGHVGDARASSKRSIMSTALSASAPVMLLRQTVIGVRSPSA